MQTCIKKIITLKENNVIHIPTVNINHYKLKLQNSKHFTQQNVSF